MHTCEISSSEETSFATFTSVGNGSASGGEVVLRSRDEFGSCSETFVVDKSFGKTEHAILSFGVEATLDPSLHTYSE